MLKRSNINKMKFYIVFVQRIIILICINFIFLQCTNDNLNVAIMDAEDCFIKPITKSFRIKELILFSNNKDYNKVVIQVPENNPEVQYISLCSLLISHRINIKEINLISVFLNDTKMNQQHFVINEDQLNLIGKDTALLFSQPIE